MEKINWEVVKLDRAYTATRKPCATITQNEIRINRSACDMINGAFHYEWIDILQARDNGKIQLLGIRFTNERKETSVPLMRHKYNGKPSGGIYINSKPLIKKLFGEAQDIKTNRFEITKADDCTLAIHLTKLV